MALYEAEIENTGISTALGIFISISSLILQNMVGVEFA